MADWRTEVDADVGTEPKGTLLNLYSPVEPVCEAMPEPEEEATGTAETYVREPEPEFDTFDAEPTLTEAEALFCAWADEAAEAYGVPALTWDAEADVV